MEITSHIMCTLPENSNLLQQLFLADDKALTIVGNADFFMLQNLVLKKATEKSQRENNTGCALKTK